MTGLVFVHAFPLDGSMWDDQVAALEDDAKVLAPSAPGFGGTEPAGDVLTMDAIADTLAAALDRAGEEKAVICGCSMGGYAAFSFWRRHKQRVAGLILVDTRAEPDDDAGKERRRKLADLARNEGADAVADVGMPLLSAGAPEDLQERTKAIIRRQPAEAIAAASLGMAERQDSRPDLPTIDVPTTIIVGSEDTLTPPPFSESMAEVIAGSDLVVLEGAGHLSNLEASDGFLRAVRDTLARVG